MEKQMEIARLIFKYWQGTLTKEEMNDLQAWRDYSFENDRVFRKAIDPDQIDAGIRMACRQEGEVEHEWEKILDHTIRKPVQRIWWKYLKYAAVLILPFALFHIWEQLKKPDQEINLVSDFPDSKIESDQVSLTFADGKCITLSDKQSLDTVSEYTRRLAIRNNELQYFPDSIHADTGYHVLTIPRGTEYKLTFADGTIVFLNSESVLKYPPFFSGEQRLVHLEGEAYFVVEKDANHPFVVDAGGMQVTVLGTSFGVRTYADENEMQTTLVEGKVNVNVGGKTLAITSGLQVHYNRNSGKADVRKVDVQRYVAWKDGRLIYDNEPLGKILNDICRMYALQVVFADEKLKELPFTLRLTKYQRISELLDMISATEKVTFSRQKNTLIVNGIDQ